MDAIFDSLYDGFPYGEWVKTDHIQKTEGGDGQPVDIYECRMPAAFHRLVALPSADSCGNSISGFAMSTGGGNECKRLVRAMADAISKGMLGLDKEGNN